MIIVIISVVVGLAIRKTEFDAWQTNPLCTPAPEAFMHCPLCLHTVEDSDHAWQSHLTMLCRKNARIKGSSGNGAGGGGGRVSSR
jgi:hypothetical protein